MIVRMNIDLFKQKLLKPIRSPHPERERADFPGSLQGRGEQGKSIF